LDAGDQSRRYDRSAAQYRDNPVLPTHQFAPLRTNSNSALIGRAADMSDTPS
jgi:hypothetical protein